MPHLQIIPTENMAHALTYASDQNCVPGQYVSIPFRNKITRGVVLESTKTQPKNPDKIKAVEHHYTELPPMQSTLLKFMQWVADYTLSNIGMLARTAIPAGVLEPPKKPIDAAQYNLGNKAILSVAQQEALDNILATDQPILLDGVTGSGKTEVYLEAIAKSLNEGKQALVLLPEIALSVQMTERFKKRFGIEPAVWHSQMTTVQRQRTWQGIATGKISIVIGARSALFLPFDKLGIIVVDEEHDGTYKQEEQIIYNARDMAIVRAQFEKAKIVLVSATPSLETMHNIAAQKYAVTHLPNRHNEATLPDIKLIDLRKEKLAAQEWLSKELIDNVQRNIESGQQSLLFLNRRGYAPLTLCRSCGFRWQCPSCSAFLVRHESHRGSFLQCHHCGYGGKMPPQCSSCGEKDNIVSCGPGIERLAEQTEQLFPDARVLMLSSDAMKNRKQAAELLAKIHNNKVDILIGTQVIAKGHHFPNLTLVCVVDGDAGLVGGDPRAGEKTWQLLHQVAGRAGRESIQGNVLIQTSIPDHPVMQTIIKHDRDHFFEHLFEERRNFNLPPYCRLAAVTIKGKDEKALTQYCHQLARSALVKPGITVLGPAPALMYKLRGFYRYRFLLRCNKSIKIQSFIQQWLGGKTSAGITTQVDIDPYTFY